MQLSSVSSLRRVAEPVLKQLRCLRQQQQQSAEQQEHDYFRLLQNPCRCGLRALVPSGNEELSPVDLDMNLVQNLLASYEAQEGLPGPVGNLFGMMGVHLPHEGRERPSM